MILPNFDGEKKSFRVWWIQSKAFCTVEGIAAAIRRKANDKLLAKEDVNANDTDQQKKARKEDMVVMSYLTMSMTTE